MDANPSWSDLDIQTKGTLILTGQIHLHPVVHAFISALQCYPLASLCKTNVSLPFCCVFVIFIHIKKTQIIWAVPIGFQIQKIPLLLNVSTNGSISTELTGDETILSPVPEEFLVLLSAVEMQLNPREGSAG